jgi:hypothetical protein
MNRRGKREKKEQEWMYEEEIEGGIIEERGEY